MVTTVQFPYNVSVNKVPQCVLDIQFQVIYSSDNHTMDEEQRGENESQEALCKLQK